MPNFDLNKALKALEFATKVGILGWSDKLSMGALKFIFQSIEKDVCYKFIEEDISMWRGWDEERWSIVRRISQKVKFSQVATMDNVMTILDKDRHDLWVIFTFHPQGKAWLDKQLTELRQKLEQEEAA